MTPPLWLDEFRRRIPTWRCWHCGAELPRHRFRAADLRRHGWQPGQTFRIPSWCGDSIEYLPVPSPGGWWALVPVWDPVEPPRNPLARYEPVGR